MPGLLVAIGATLLGAAGVVGGWGLTQLGNNGVSLAKTGAAIAVGAPAAMAIDGAIHNIDTVIQQAFPSMPGFPDSLESVVAGIISPLIVGAVAYQFAGDSVIGRVGVGATYGGMMAINLSNALAAAGSDLIGLESLIRNQGVFGLKGFVADTVAQGAGYVAKPLKGSLDMLSGWLTSPVKFLQNVPVLGDVAKNYLNAGAVAGIATIHAWGSVMLLAPLFAAYHAALKIPGKIWDHKSSLAVPAAYLAVRYMTPGMLGAAGFRDPSIPIWSDFLGIGAATYLGYALNKSRSTRFAVAAGAGLMTAAALNTYFGTMDQVTNYVSSLGPALSPVKNWIPGFVGASAGLVAEAYRQSYRKAHKFAVPVKYGLMAGLGYVAASNMNFGNPEASLWGAGLGMGIGAVVDGAYHGIKNYLKSGRSHAPAAATASAPAGGMAVVAT